MRRLRFGGGERLSGLGWYGVVGLGLLVFAGAFYFSAIRPEQSELAAVARDVAQLRERGRLPIAVKPQTPADKVAAFYGFFPSPATLPDQLEKIFAIAEAQTLQLEQGEYRVVKDTAGRLTRV